MTDDVVDLDSKSEVIIFELLLTTFKASIIFIGSLGSCKT